MSDHATDVDAVILAGGLGTRLRAAVADRPKVLAEVAGRPFLAYLLDDLVRAGVRHIVLCTGYRAEAVQATFGDRFGPATLEYSVEPEPRGTGGALRLALPLVRTPHVLALNGDSYCGLDWRALAAADRRCDWLTVTRVDDTDRYGRVEFAPPDSRVTRFAEKGAGRGPGWINAGIYRLSRRRLAGIPADRAVSLERDCFPAWCGRLRAFPAAGPFLDIGTPESYRAAATFLQQLGRTP